jgi:arylsulfatase
MKKTLLLLLPALFLAEFNLATAADAKRPNVIVFLTDDNGYGDHECLGNPVLKTPNFNRLHSQSVRFTDFHVAPMCTPTRGQLMSGLDCLHSGASSVCAGRSFLRRGIPTMANIFAAGGYRTAHFGKWHLGDSYPNLPHQRGFEDSVYLLGWGITSIADTWGNDYFDGRFSHNGVLKQYKGYCTDLFFDLTMQWIKERKEKNEPFFVYLPTNAAHGPHWVPEKYKKPYQGKGPAAFFGMIANLDENLGRLDTFLRENGLFDNTLLVYMNDNGGTAGVQTFNAGMRGHKTQYYDGGHRAVCWVRWPGGPLRKPCDLDSLTEVQDILPTLVDLCALPKPKDASFDGTSLAGLLKGTSDTFPDRMLVVQYGQVPTKWDSAVMWNKWRLVKGKELYNIKDDPGQKKDIASANAEVVDKMRAHYEKWWAGVEPRLQDFSPISIGSEKENPGRLSAADWANVYCDNAYDVRNGLNKNGVWHILVEQDGSYEIELRRWPKEADANIVDGVPAFKAVDGGVGAAGQVAGKALPIAKARLKLGTVDESKAVAAGDKGITFEVNLKAGKTTMQTWFNDKADKQLCGAYYVYVKRK